jgi:type VI protein secretion system component Hcp
MSAGSEPSIFLSFEGVAGEQVLPAETVPSGPGKGWTQLLACRFTADVNVQSRAMSKGGKSRVDFGGDAPPIEISKRSDSATVGLMREMLAGKDFRRAAIVFVRTDEGGPTEYMRYNIEKCRIVGFDFTGADDDRAVETFAIHYVEMTLIAFAGGHGAKGAQSPAVLLNGA